jgi:hypothetical protein
MQHTLLGTLSAPALLALAAGCVVPYRYPERYPPPLERQADAAAPEARPATGPGASRRAADGRPPAVTTAPPVPPATRQPLRDDGRGAALEAGDYRRPMPFFHLLFEGSQEVEEEGADGAHAFGLGLYVIPLETPFGAYVNGRWTGGGDGNPDYTDVFAFNAFGHPIVDEDLTAFVLNFGVVKPLNESVSVFLGLGYANTQLEAEFRDPLGTIGDNGRYFQRHAEDEELNVNLGALVVVHPVAVTVQWDTALEVFTFGAGVRF